MQMKPKRTTMIAVKKNWALTGQSRPNCFFTVTCASRSAAREGNKQTKSAQRHQIVAQDKKRAMKQECIHAHACWYIPQDAIRHIHVHTSLHAHMSLIYSYVSACVSIHPPHPLMHVSLWKSTHATMCTYKKDDEQRYGSAPPS